MLSLSIVFVCAVALLVLLMSAHSTHSAAPASQPQVIILKLDDVTDTISPQWYRVADFLEQRKIKAAFGIVCQSLERSNDDTLHWIKSHQSSGLVEFWLHGYTMRTEKDQGEFEHGTFEEQKALLDKSEALAREKLGFPLRTFGPHWSGTTDETLKAVNAVLEIEIYLYGPTTPGAFRGLSLPRVMVLEDPIFVPDFDKFKATYERVGVKESVLVLQGHPPGWGDADRWEGFVKIIDFLQARGCVFMTPSEYQASLKAPSSSR